jgi:hypothetical protein
MIEATEEAEDDAIPPSAAATREERPIRIPCWHCSTWMPFTTTVPLTVGVIPRRLNRRDVYLEDAASGKVGVEKTQPKFFPKRGPEFVLKLEIGICVQKQVTS